MALIRKANELEINPIIKMLIYGQSGAGKTTLALSASKKTLLIDFDGGINRVDYSLIGDTGTVQIISYQDFLDVLDSQEINEFDTLVIDTGGKMLDFMADYIMTNDYKTKNKSGSLTLQGYGVRKNMFTQLVKRVSTMRKNIIFIAQREERKEGDDTRFTPQFGGSNYDALVTELDLVGYIEMDGRKRTITFDPTSRSDGKNTCNLPSLMVIPEIINQEGNKIGENDFLIKNVITPFVDRIKQRRELGIQFENLMKSIENEIDLITDDQSANDFLKRINEFNHTMNSLDLSKRKLHSKSTSLGLSFDAQKKLYVKPSKKETANV